MEPSTSAPAGVRRLSGRRLAHRWCRRLPRCRAGSRLCSPVAAGGATGTLRLEFLAESFRPDRDARRSRRRRTAVLECAAAGAGFRAGDGETASPARARARSACAPRRRRAWCSRRARSEIRGHVDTRDGEKADAGIVDLPGQQFGQVFANLLADPGRPLVTAFSISSTPLSRRARRRRLRSRRRP